MWWWSWWPSSRVAPLFLDGTSDKDSQATTSANQHPPPPPPSWSKQPLVAQVPNLASSDASIIADLHETQTLSIRIITWNQEAKPPPPPSELSALFPTGKYHILAVSAQECENSFARSVLNPYKTKWEATMIAALGPSYRMVRSHALQTTHAAVFIHKVIAHLLSDVTSFAVPTGIGNTLGNKGAIGISFIVGGKTRLCFVGGHLSAFQNNTDRRTYEFASISHDLSEAICDLNGYSMALETAEEGNNTNLAVLTGDERDRDRDRDASFNNAAAANQSLVTMANPLISNFDQVFWFGDMNYRIEATREDVDQWLEVGEHRQLLDCDQLRREMASCNTCTFHGFSEGPLNFRPTYKFDEDSDSYDTSKKRRIPSWTDRILFKAAALSGQRTDAESGGGEHGHVELLAYNSVANLRMSDHRPVYASFRARIDLGDDSIGDRNRRRDPFVRSESLSEVCIIL